MFDSISEYFQRAEWAYGNATREGVRPEFQSYLAAFAIHACQSLKETLDEIASDAECDPELTTSIKSLPHRELVENIRNMDLHGWPIPICRPGMFLSGMVSKPGHPIEISSRDGVAVALTATGASPKVFRSPNVPKKGNVKFGGATVSFECNNGVLIAHDFSTDKKYPVLEAVRAFLLACHPLLFPDQKQVDEPTSQATAETPIGDNADTLAD